MLTMKESVLRFEEKTHTTFVYLLSNCLHLLKHYFKTNLLNTIFDDFSM